MARGLWLVLPLVIANVVAFNAGCSEDWAPAYQRLARARQLAASLLVDFSRAYDAANRAVMADTDEASLQFAREAEQARAQVGRHAAALSPLLKVLGDAEETKLLADFSQKFSSYEQLDRTILTLAVENTNLKAQHLSFGPASQAATAFADTLAGLAGRGPCKR